MNTNKHLAETLPSLINSGTIQTDEGPVRDSKSFCHPRELYIPKDGSSPYLQSYVPPGTVTPDFYFHSNNINFFIKNLCEYWTFAVTGHHLINVAARPTALFAPFVDSVWSNKGTDWIKHAYLYLGDGDDAFHKANHIHIYMDSEWNKLGIDSWRWQLTCRGDPAVAVPFGGDDGAGHSNLEVLLMGDDITNMLPQIQHYCNNFYQLLMGCSQRIRDEAQNNANSSPAGKGGGRKSKRVCCAGPGCPEWKHCIHVLGDGDKYRPKSKAALKRLKIRVLAANKRRREHNATKKKKRRPRRKVRRKRTRRKRRHKRTSKK